jgi:hypothetical protein
MPVGKLFLPLSLSLMPCEKYSGVEGKEGKKKEVVAVRCIVLMTKLQRACGCNDGASDA